MSGNVQYNVVKFTPKLETQKVHFYSKDIPW